RDLMAPPELARDAPGLDVAHPFEEGVLPVLGDKHGAAGLDRADRLLRQRLGVAIPLVGEPRLDDDARAVAVRHHVSVRLGLLDEPERLEIGEDALSRLEAIEATIGLRRVLVQSRVTIEDVDELEPVPPPDLEIVEVVRRGDLDGAATRRG